MKEITEAKTIKLDVVFGFDACKILLVINKIMYGMFIFTPAQEDKWYLSIPYCYLNESTMTRIVNESIEAVLIVQEKVKNLKDLNGLASSVSLLPEYLTIPYQEPLGNK